MSKKKSKSPESNGVAVWEKKSLHSPLGLCERRYPPRHQNTMVSHHVHSSSRSKCNHLWGSLGGSPQLVSGAMTPVVTGLTPLTLLTSGVITHLATGMNSPFWTTWKSQTSTVPAIPWPRSNVSVTKNSMGPLPATQAATYIGPQHGSVQKWACNDHGHLVGGFNPSEK